MMDLKKLKNYTFLTAALGAIAYSAITGKGFFNRPRFKEQHKALEKYMDNNYPGCIYTPITIHGKGWSSGVIKNGVYIAIIYFSKGTDGVYVFTEAKPAFGAK